MATWTGPGVLPPPPGQQANFVDPPDMKTTTIALHTVFLTIATTCMAIRLYTRHFINHSLGIDDWCCLFGYCNTVVFSSLLIWGETQGLGRHIWDVLKTQLPIATKALTIAEYFYLIAAGLIKLSCLLFYRRIFNPNKKVLGFIWAGIVFVALGYTIILFLTIFDCWPIEKEWNQAIPGHCLPPKGLPYSSGVLNVVTDLYVLILPFPVVWSLQIRTARKLRVISLFCLGIFVCITSIVRLAMTPILYGSTDVTSYLGNISVWAVVEIDVGLICACLLAFPAFIEHYKGSRMGTYLSNLVTSFTGSRAHSTKTTNKVDRRWKTEGSGSPNGSTYGCAWEEIGDHQAVKAEADGVEQRSMQYIPSDLAHGKASRRDEFEMRAIRS